MNSTTFSEISEPEADYLQYRALSMSAVMAVVLGLLSLPAIILPGLLILPIAGTLVSLYSLRKLSRRSEELTGKKPATIGLILSLGSFVLGSGLAAYTYATEVPEGYERVTFYELQPTRESPELPVSPRALELNGKKVFLKGYVLPDDRRTGLSQFVLVPDMKSCCFGGTPKITDMVYVTLQDPLRVDYSLRMRRLTGVLKVDTRPKPLSGVGGVYFELDADNIK